MKLARHIKGLAGVKFGPPAASLRKAVVTCVQSSALYGSEVWYGGRLKPSSAGGYNRNQLVSTRLGLLIEEVDRAIVLAARGVLPVWRIAPTASVLRDAGLPSGSTALEHARIRPAPTLAARNEAAPGGCTSPSRPRPILAQPHFSPGCRTNPTKGRTKEDAAKQFNTWWNQLNGDTITVFSDGSEQYNDGAKLVGYGYAVYRGQSLVRTGSGAINSTSHVFDAEAIGALKGLQCALEILQPSDGQLWMCIDSTSVIWCMRANAPNTSNGPFSNAIRLSTVTRSVLYGLRAIWVSKATRMADELADAGAKGRAEWTTTAQQSPRSAE
ncbi:hypothetical protein DID88_010511 [Monilinia fructigena]|uniref:Uncharacterized protein n=1 Tax=Monilinia fructigena TaxID=38457 RepID=A0A395ILC7_9HELO|nr:hypothetical protein DID88_010511 [Monilinia fructigena]